MEKAQPVLVRGGAGLWPHLQATRPCSHDRAFCFLQEGQEDSQVQSEEE